MTGDQVLDAPASGEARLASFGALSEFFPVGTVPMPPPTL
jgi:hypothetical protein